MIKKIILLFWIFTCLVLAAININTADEKTLTQLKGIGPVKAKAIIDFREKYGKFHNIEELQHVKGIGPKTVEKIRSEVTVK